MSPEIIRTKLILIWSDLILQLNVHGAGKQYKVNPHTRTEKTLWVRRKGGGSPLTHSTPLAKVKNTTISFLECHSCPKSYQIQWGKTKRFRGCVPDPHPLDGSPSQPPIICIGNVIPPLKNSSSAVTQLRNTWQSLSPVITCLLIIDTTSYRWLTHLHHYLATGANVFVAC